MNSSPPASTAFPRDSIQAAVSATRYQPFPCGKCAVTLPDHALLLPYWVLYISSPPVIIGTPADSIRIAKPVRAAWRCIAGSPPWSQELLLSSPPSLGPKGQA